MDPATLSLMMQGGEMALGAGAGIFENIMLMNQRDKDRREKAKLLADSYMMQNKAYDQRIDFAKRNAGLVNKDALDELVNYSFNLSNDDTSVIENFMAQRVR